MERFACWFIVSAAGWGMFLSGCVDIAPGGHPEAADAMPYARVRGLDPGGKNLASLHFEVFAYDFETTRTISELCERRYNAIMTDTGLDAFRPRRLYRIMVYATREEFLRKTGLPPWSAGAAAGSSIYTYEGPHLEWVLPHEMTHLIFVEYMGTNAFSHKWLNEGLAVYEEQQAALMQAPSRYGSAPIPFSAMLTLVPLTEKDRKVSAWYHQVGSVVRFLIERSRGPGFHLFLRALRGGMSVDDALRAGYPGQWTRFSDVERAWGSAQ